MTATPQAYKKKLIEVALPLEAINNASASEKGNPFLRGHPRNLHQWWARRPLATARAVIFAQMVDDPSAHPDLFPTEKKQEKERQRLFRIIEDLVLWENTANENVLERARAEIWQSWRAACAENVDHPRAKELFNRHKLPAFHDPFAGGGALPLEAQRLGLESYASDLNPVAVLINKAMIEIPPKFAGKPPVNPQSRAGTAHGGSWKGAQGLADDARYYGRWMRDEAEKRIGHLYPKIEVTADIAKGRPDLTPYIGKELTVIAWLWARTVKSPNPAFTKIDVPLASTFMLSIKAGKEAYVEAVIDGGGYRFTVKGGKPKDVATAKNGTKLSRGANFRCVMSGTPIAPEYIKVEGKAGRMGARLMAVVAEGDRGRVYLPPVDAMEAIALQAKPEWKPDLVISGSTQYLGVKPYGMDQFSQLFTNRQIVALTTFSDLAQEARERVKRDALAAGLPDDGKPLALGGNGVAAYADVIATLMALSLDKLADYNNTICMWNPTNQNIGHLFTKQAIPMSWDFAETSPLFGGLSFDSIVEGIAKSIELLPVSAPGWAFQQDCTRLSRQNGPPIISTDPPYYDNVPYADLSDFFYVWLRRPLQTVFPDLFATLATPKTAELVAFSDRHENGRNGAEIFFLEGMTHAMHRLAEQAHPAFPVTIYYAFKQAETENDSEGATASTGWQTFLDATVHAGFAITGTWPMRTERGARSRGIGANALASSIILVCRPRADNAPSATRREFVTALKAELPVALAHLQRSNIAPVDLAQAAIGPGMAVYTRYAKVLDAEGKPLSVREALALINQTLDDALAEQEGDFDADSRWALTWFEQSGFAEGEYGVAEQLSKSKNTSVEGMKEAGILASSRGKVRLLRPSELAPNWDPATDPRRNDWEVVHQLIRTLEAGGERATAAVIAKLGTKAEIARELAYRLYTICERKKRAAEALSYNGLVQSWPEIMRLTRESPRAAVVGTDDLFNQE
jgi:putative DNA methylase